MKKILVICALSAATRVDFEKYVDCNDKILSKQKYKDLNNFGKKFVSFKDFKSQFKK